MRLKIEGRNRRIVDMTWTAYALVALIGLTLLTFVVRSAQADVQWLPCKMPNKCAAPIQSL